MGTSSDPGAATRRWRDRLAAALRPRTNGDASQMPDDARSVPSGTPAAKPGSAGAEAVAASLDDVLREIVANRAARPDADRNDGTG